MKYLICTILFANILFANSTMCYKNKITDVSTVENEKFDGGECNSTYSILDMKKSGWNISDIKISQKNDLFNFIYILKKDTKVKAISNGKVDYAKLSKIIKEDKQKQEDKIAIKNGKRIYNKNCKLCHGLKAELKPQNTSLAINTFNLEQLQDTMRAYTWNEQDKGFAFVMKPYAEVTTPTDIQNIFKYLKTINK